ncbi:polysaccharide pyruvyl transferase family protein [Sphaerochaeta halotolerans]|uniref:Polysaccharide pyruvyl transferase family protein n=1 Tax=Sphaerochaeta halotolerans TaxID=2293840 RepID=A0A372MKM2_9SPIR|nr:polysaccharide pyruvyl transferase family protein [Sphaerochaeta halotolerans]RFU96274.1 polysaccharide pyruvyl transferase family protein [Sphaerochaeta halotolerans]
MENFNSESKKKYKTNAAILTLNGYHNYGNRFQNYALQQTLLKYFDTVDTLSIRNKNENLLATQSKSSNLFKKINKLTFSRLVEKLVNFFWNELLLRRTIEKRRLIRQKAFFSFSNTYIKEVDIGLYPDSIPSELGEKYDYFIVGSDQVWNPTFPEFSELFFLTFAPKNKRVTYAPSFGLVDLPIELKENFTRWLKEIKHISVREKAGADIINNLTGRDVPIVLDPTMLLTKEEWLKVSIPINDNPKGPYILTYFLGKLDYKTNNEIVRFARKHHMKIVRINEPTSKYYTSGPGELLTLINQASLILTDSFHGTVFSLLFQKPFLTYKRSGNRDNMFSRIESLFSLLHLQKRLDMSLSDPNLLNIDYSEVNRLLQSERDKAIDYLVTCFEV